MMESTATFRLLERRLTEAFESQRKTRGVAEDGGQEGTEAALREAQEKLLVFLKERLQGHESVALSHAEHGSTAMDEDEELQAMEREVLQTAQRLSDLRGAVPKQVRECISADLTSSRPDCSDQGAMEVEHDADGAKENEPVDAVEDTGAGGMNVELQDRLGSAAAKAPVLRAKLQECLDRMERLSSCITALNNSSGAPGSVERVLAGTPRSAGPETPASMATCKLILRELQSEPNYPL